jgi:hypothetical protein
MKNFNDRSCAAAFASLLFLLAFPVLSSAGGQGASGIVTDISKAPVIMDGNVSGKPFDMVITLDGALDPSVPGRTLAAGGTIRITFPHAYDLGNLGGFPLANAGSSPNCVPGNLICSTGVLLQGWPQNPVPPPNYSLSIEGNTLVYTALQDIVPNPPGAPGIKQMHMILNGLTNPKPGHYRIRVDAETGPGGSVESGSVLAHILPKQRPSINVTSVFTGLPGPESNTIYQTTAVNTMAPLEWSFLVWGKKTAVLDDITLEWVEIDEAELRQSGRTVGHVYLDAPPGATGHDVYVTNSTGLSAAPVIGGTPGIGPQPVGLLQLQFVAGSEAGEYVTTVMLNGGNSVQMRVAATP